MEQEGHKSHRTDFAPIMETSYLTAQNVRQYRAIMRLFFREYEKMYFQLYKEDVLELLHRQEGFADYTMAQLVQDLEALADVFHDMLELAEVEKTMQLLAEDIEKTRRRVNALEYVMIPGFQEKIRYISMKLDENERGNITRLMKVKDMLLKEAIEERRGATEEALQTFSDTDPGPVQA